MNLADQIEALARTATAGVAEASHVFSARQRDLELAMDEHRRNAVRSETQLPEGGPTVWSMATA